MGLSSQGQTTLLETFALDGALSGLVAVVLMTLFETPFWHQFGMKGVVQWQVNEIIVSRLLSKPYVEGKRLRWAIGMHLFHGVALGALFAIWLTSVHLPLYLTGLVYSIALWSFIPFSLRDALQRAGRVSFTNGGMTVSLLAHVVYGLALGEILSILLR